MLGSSEQPGVIPRAVREVFNLVNAKDEDEGWDYSISMSYLEIYNEKVFMVCCIPVLLHLHTCVLTFYNIYRKGVPPIFDCPLLNS